MSDPVRIWHYGLVARWWAEFNEGGEDVDYFREAILRSGEPALDAGCGTGRLLLHFLRQGMDVDGSDASPDMLEWCRSKAESEGLAVNLYPQAMHQLDLPRRYRSIVVCGAFGLGGTREDDLEGLRRMHAHLEPGGKLIMDHHVPNRNTQEAEAVAQGNSTQDWPAEGDRRRAADGTELELRIRLSGFNRETQTATREICVRQFVEEKEVASETYAIDLCVYSAGAIESLLGSAGFSEVRITGGLEDRPRRRGEDELIVFHATA